jgi:hypothetical protein
VIYYHLPQDESTNPLEKVKLNIYDSNNTLVRSFTSDKMSQFLRYDGGPSKEPVLSVSKGLNRFVWDMRTFSRPGVPNVYIEGSYRGHKVMPGKYIVELAFNKEKWTKEVEIISNPHIKVSQEVYQDYNTLLTQLSSTYTTMVNTVNLMSEYKEQLVQTQLWLLKKELGGTPTFAASNTLIEAIDQWDKNMVQRKSKAYDDVDNFENKMTGNYLFLVNQAESDIPAVTKAVLEEQKRLDALWSAAYKDALNIIDIELPAFNKLLLENGVGAINLYNKKN